MDNKKVSIIIPIYNVAEYLPALFKSLDSQDYKNYECIFVDDCSTDDSCDLCKKYCEDKSNCVVIEKHHNEGLNPARETGLHYATGYYISFIDSDDFVEKDYLSYMVSGFIEGVDIVCAPTLKEDKDGNVIEIVGKTQTEIEIWDRDTAIYMLFEGKNVRCYMHSKVFKKEVLMNVDFSFNRPFEDFVSTTISFCNSKKICKLSEPKYHYILRKGSLSSKSKHSFLSAIDAMIIRKKYVMDNCPLVDINNLADREIIEWFIEIASVSVIGKRSKYYGLIKSIYNNNLSLRSNARFKRNMRLYFLSPYIFRCLKKLLYFLKNI